MNKADKLKQVLRQMIREEVTEQVNKAMGKILVEVLKETKVSVPVSKESEESQSRIELKSTGNPALDSVLAETAKHHKPIPRETGSSLAELMGEGFEKIGRGEQVVTDDPARSSTKLDFLKQMVSESAPVAQQSITESAEVPDALKKVFKRDFRDVMKAIDRQKKEGSSGMFVGKVTLDG